MALPENAKYFADLNTADTLADAHLLPLQQGTPPAGAPTPTPTRKLSLAVLKAWVIGFLGNAATRAVGGATGQVIDPAALQGGVDVGGSAPVGPYSIGRVTGSAPVLATRFLLLCPDAGNRHVFGKLLIQRSNGGGGARWAEVNVRLRRSESDTANPISALLTYAHTGTASAAVRLVTLTYAGQQWIALGLGNGAVYQQVYFNGYSSVVKDADWLRPVGDADVTGVANVTLASTFGPYFGGRPGDAIGQNQALYIAGSPGTARACTVDSNGFVKAV